MGKLDESQRFEILIMIDCGDLKKTQNEDLEMIIAKYRDFKYLEATVSRI